MMRQAQIQYAVQAFLLTDFGAQSPVASTPSSSPPYALRKVEKDFAPLGKGDAAKVCELVRAALFACSRKWSNCKRL